jgi:TolB-like protein/DNA-binding winged helix-turn-helix (wHTH) protein/Tfp pilus assembly protein PilF
MAETDQVHAYRFGLFDVDRRTGELRKQGLRLRLRGRPIDILLVLLERPGEVVTRDELRQRLWPADTFVDFDHGLHSAVNRLREALGDAAENPRFIETLPRRGYRFIAPVTPVPAAVAAPAAPLAEAEAPDSVETPRATALPTHVPGANPKTPAGLERQSWSSWHAAALLGGAIALAAVAYVGWLGRSTGRSVAKMTIAVLPFANLSGDPDQEYLSDGFTEELIAELGTIVPDRLSVIGRSTSILYKGARKSVGDIGRELGVMYLLDGSVRRSGSRVRVTAQLVETHGMTNLWTDSYERDVGDVLTVQSDVARQIARSLALALAPDAPARTGATSPPFEAYDLYMRGRYFREQATEDGARRAIEHYERALAIDPDYAAAHAAIADAYRLLGAPGWEVERPLTLLTRAKAAAERALALDPRSPEARAVLAMIRFNFEWDLDGAEREIQAALAINPSFAQAHQYHSGILMTMGRMDAAIEAARRAVELDPLAPTATTSLGVRYYYARRPTDAIEQFRKTLEIAPSFPVAHWGLAQVYRQQKRFAEQVAELQRATTLSGNSSYMRAHLAYGFAVAGNRSNADALRQELRAEASARYVAPYHFALIAAGLGETDEAMRWLERAFEDRSGWLVFLPVEPEFDGMRTAPAFRQLLARVTPQR